MLFLDPDYLLPRPDQYYFSSNTNSSPPFISFRHPSAKSNLLSSARNYFSVCPVPTTRPKRQIWSPQRVKDPDTINDVRRPPTRAPPSHNTQIVHPDGDIDRSEAFFRVIYTYSRRLTVLAFLIKGNERVPSTRRGPGSSPGPPPRCW